MSKIRQLAVTTALFATLSACAQAAPPPQPLAPASATWTARMDQQMTAMHALHDQMAEAKTPEAREALMASHRELMQSGMQMMRGMGPGPSQRGMAGMGTGMGSGGRGPGVMHGTAGTPADRAARQAWTEKRMEMMQSMMQLMVDRLPPEPAKQ